MSHRPAAESRHTYPHISRLTTRWMDNDVYGHINNVVYYSFFDTVVNSYLIEHGALDMQASAVIGLVVETRCNYFRPLAYPQSIDAGLRVAHMGRTSVRYEVGLFAESDEWSAAGGHFVHVYVDRVSQQPVALPARLRDVLASLKASA